MIRRYFVKEDPGLQCEHVHFSPQLAAKCAKRRRKRFRCGDLSLGVKEGDTEVDPAASELLVFTRELEGEP